MALQGRHQLVKATISDPIESVCVCRQSARRDGKSVIKPARDLPPAGATISAPQSGDLKFWLMPSRDIRLLRLTLMVLGTSTNDVAEWLGISRQRVTQWSSGRDPMPWSRQVQLFEVMKRRLELMRRVIFGRSPFLTELEEHYLDYEAGEALITLMDSVMAEEAERLSDIKRP